MLEKVANQQDDCGICFEVNFFLSNLKNISIEKAGALECGHLFCFDCIKKAGVYKRKCPLCR
jgi:hypothetical protein